VKRRLTATAVAGSVAAALVLALTPGSEAAQARERRVGQSDPHALLLLERAVLAPATTAYSGTQFVSAWGSLGTTSALVDVEHLPGYGTVTRVATAPGVRGGSSFTPEQSGSADSDGAAAMLGPLARMHHVELAGTGTVAGRVVDIVLVRRPADSSVAGRFWIDREYGIVLRREVYDHAGRVIRASAFIAVTMGAFAVPAHLPPMSAVPWQQRLQTVDLASMRDNGWHAPEELPGLSLYDVRRTAEGGRTVLHLGYSDGLSNVSVFEQRGHLDASRLSGYTVRERGGVRVHERVGIPTELLWSSRGTVYTLVADAPPEVVDEAVASLPHDVDEPGVGARMGRGLDRVVAWFNPFD
jgi:sigma-E factor negative regulatory protein RseB